MERAGTDPWACRAAGRSVRAALRPRQGRRSPAQGRHGFKFLPFLLLFLGGTCCGRREDRVQRGAGSGVVRLDPVPAARDQWIRGFGFQTVPGEDYLEWSSNLAP
jgi:hypothetical protein